MRVWLVVSQRARTLARVERSRGFFVTRARAMSTNQMRQSAFLYVRGVEGVAIARFAPGHNDARCIERGLKRRTYTSIGDTRGRGGRVFGIFLHVPTREGGPLVMIFLHCAIPTRAPSTSLEERYTSCEFKGIVPHRCIDWW